MEPNMEQKIRRSAENIVEKFLIKRDEQEAWLRFKNSFDESNFKDFMKQIICVSFKKSGGPKKNLPAGKMLKYFIKHELISKETYLEGLTGILESIEDLEIDMPNASREVASVIVYLLVKKAIPLREVVDRLVQLNKPSLSTKFINNLFELLMKKKKHEWVDLTWILSKASLKDVASTDDINNFFEELLRLYDSHTRAMQQIKRELKQIIVVQILGPDKISDSSEAQIDQMLDVNGDHNLDPKKLKNLVKSLSETEFNYKLEPSENSNRQRLRSRSSSEDSYGSLSPVREEKRNNLTLEKSLPSPAFSAEDNHLNEDNLKDKIFFEGKINGKNPVVGVKNEEIYQETASTNKAYNLSHVLVIKNLIKSGVLVLKHNYLEGQWSPINLEGKKQYNRNFIMEIMHDPQSKKKPAIRPYLSEIVKQNKQQPQDRNVCKNVKRGDGVKLLPHFVARKSSR